MNQYKHPLIADDTNNNNNNKQKIDVNNNINSNNVNTITVNKNNKRKASTDTLLLLLNSNNHNNDDENNNNNIKRYKIDTKATNSEPNNGTSASATNNKNDFKMENTISVYSNWRYTQYAEDILNALREKEKKRGPYLKQSPQINHRKRTIDFLRYVAVKKSLSRTTVHLAIYLLDMFMDGYDIALDKLNFVGIVILLISSKIEETETRIPKICELNYFIDKMYPKKDYVMLEKCIFKTFSYDLIIPTAAIFIEYYIEGIIGNYEEHIELSIINDVQIPINKMNVYEIKKKLASIVLEFLDLTLKDALIMQELPSIVSAACIAAARQTYKIEPIWAKHLVQLTNYEFSSIENCMLKLLILHQTELFNNSMNSTRIPITPESGYISNSEYNKYDDEDDDDDDEGDDDEDDLGYEE